MKIVSPNVELLRQEPGLKGIFKQIELAGRTCYKSEDKINDVSAKFFVERMIESKHYAMLEHGTVYLTLVINTRTRQKTVHYPWYYNNAIATNDEVFSYIQCLFLGNKYSVVKLSQNKDYTETTMCITTNYRVIIENGWLGIMNEFLSEPTLYHERRISLKFTTNIGVTREGNRHRVNSIAEESTRYCNYTKDKFGNEITFVKPVWFSDILPEGHYEIKATSIECDGKSININTDKTVRGYLYLLHCAEEMYFKMIENGSTPQQAREVLPLATKSEIVYTAFVHDWKHWFDLRLFGTTGKPHPNIEQVAELAQKVLIENNLWDLIYNPDDKNP